MVLTSLLLAGGSLSLAFGYYYFLQQRKMYKLYENLEKIPEFDFDYIGQLQELPLNKIIALCAEIDTERVNSKPSLYNTRKRVIFSRIQKILPRDKKITKQVLSDENEHFDEFYNAITNFNLPKLYLRNTKQERIEIRWPDVKEIGLFNIKPIAEKIDPAKIPNVPTDPPIEKLLALIPNRKKTEYGEVGLEPDDKYVYIGEISEPTQKYKDKLDYNLIFKPKYILGESKDFFIKYLDGQLVKLNKRTKKSFMIAGVFTLAYIGVHLYSRYQVGQRRKPAHKNQPPK